MATELHQLEDELSGEDLLSIANKVVRAKLIGGEVLEHLTSLHPQVPVSMGLRYLKQRCYQSFEESGWYNRQNVDDFLSNAFGGIGNAATELQLGLKHASKLTEILAKYASKWRLIGTALRFHCQDLDNIQASHACMVDSLKLNLIRLVEDWLQKKHLYTLPPTRRCLVEALRSSIVELGDVASELEFTSIYYEHPAAPVADHALPYCIIKVNSSRISKVVYTEENKSILLEVQNENMHATCQWLLNGQQIKDDIQYSGSNGSILYVAGDINLDGCNFSCRIQDIQTTVPVTLKVSCPLDNHTRCLASMYLDQPEVPEDTWPPQSSNTHVNLAIIKQDKKLNYRNKYARETIRNDMDDVFQHKEKIEYSDVMNSLKSGQVLFVEGRPGCGKTTFVNKITQDWSRADDGPLRLVLLVSLRILNILCLQKPTLDLSDLLQLFNKLKVSKEAIEQRNGRGVCFIFDGLDEFSPRDGKESIIFRIIQKHYLDQSTVIVASRPAATAKWRHKATKIIEVLGFLKEQILEYFDIYPFSEELKSIELREYIVSHPNILHMCYLPIHAAMVAYLYEVTGEIPRTDTEIYTHFTRFTITRSLSKKTDIEKIDAINLIGNDKKLFGQICELALDKTVHNKQVLHQDEVKKSSEANIGDLGLITVDRIAGLYNYKNIYTFLHLTFQEYLAACHISTLTDEEQLELIKKHGGKVHMLVVWKFYCGLVKLDSTGGMFEAVMRKTAGTTLHKIQCAYESQQPISCNIVVKSVGWTLCFENQNLTTPDFSALGYVLVNDGTSSPIALSLIRCTLGDSGMDALLSETGNKSCLLQTLKYSSNSPDEVMIGCLEKLLSFSRSLQCLDFSASDANTQCSLETISSTIAKSCSNLTELSVSNILIGPSNVQYILSECKQLTKLTLMNVIGEAEYRLFLAKLKHCMSLENVKISCVVWNGVSQTFKLCTGYKGVCLKISGQQIELSLSRHTQVESVRGIISNAVILDNRPPEKTSSGYAEGIMCIRDLEELTISKDFLSKVELLKLIHNLDQQRSLKILNLGEANLDATGAIAISSSLKHCTALRTLNLRGNTIGKKGVQALSSGFQYWPNLQELNLDGRVLDKTYRTNIGSDGAVVLAEQLQLCPRLSKLHLEYNGITKDIQLLLEKKCHGKLYIHGISAAEPEYSCIIQ